ncbi:MAG: hypothetical protein JWR15_3944 [Prosthecobacter sp.]|nr:hypothetical protein [Prosthecobacter sp.]
MNTERAAHEKEGSAIVSPMQFLQLLMENDRLRG